MMSLESDSSDMSGHTKLTYFQEQAYRLHYQLVNRVIKDVKDEEEKKQHSSHKVKCKENTLV